MAKQGNSNPEARMPLREHLAEFRKRIMWILLGILLGAIGGWFLFDWFFAALKEPIDAIEQGSPGIVSINFSTMGGGLDMRIKMSVFLGFVITSPWWLYQIWAFIRPGLKKSEKRYALYFLGAAIPLFIGGVALAWFTLPQAVKILSGFLPQGSTAIYDGPLYLHFFMQFMVIVGLGFVFPALMVTLSSLSVISGKAWLKGWRWAVLLITIFSAIMTPSPDALPMLIIGAPMILLYFMAVGICLLIDRRRAKQKMITKVA